MPDPKGFDYFLRGRPLPVVGGESATTGFDYFLRGRSFPAILTASAVSATGTINTQSIAVSGQAITATSGQVTATVNADTVAVSGQSILGSSGATGAVTADTVAVSGQTVSGISGSNGLVTTDTVGVAGQSVSGVSGSVGTVSPDSVALAGQAISGTVSPTGVVTTDTVAVAGQLITATSGQVTGTVAPDTVAVSGQTVLSTTGSTSTVTTDTVAIAGQVVTGDFTISATGAVSSQTVGVSGQAIVGVTGSVGVVQELQQSSFSLFRNVGNTDNSQRTSQGFTPTTETRVWSISFRLSRSNSPVDSLFAEIYAASSGLPTGSPIATSEEIVGSSLSTSQEWVALTFDGQTVLNAGTTYCVVLRRTGLIDASNYYQVGYHHNNPYPGHGVGTYIATSVWIGPSATDDLAFILSTSVRVIGHEVVAAVSVNGLVSTDTVAVSGQGVSGVTGSTGLVNPDTVTIAGVAVGATTGAVGEVLVDTVPVVHNTVNGTGIVNQLGSVIADVSDGGWTNQDDSTVDLFDSLDEVTANDADYIKSSASPASPDLVDLQLTPFDVPGTRTGHIIQYRYKKDGPGLIQLTAFLYCGEELIAADDALEPTDTEQTRNWELTEAEAETITDYENLILQFEAVV